MSNISSPSLFIGDTNASDDRTSALLKPNNKHRAKRAQVLIAPKDQPKIAEPISKRKQPKSRNGCLTCKRKRRKCDESKPACEQCTRRKLTCGGYAKDLRWKQIAKPRNFSSPRDNTARSKCMGYNPTIEISMTKTTQPTEDTSENCPSPTSLSRSDERDGLVGDSNDIFHHPNLAYSSPPGDFREFVDSLPVPTSFDVIENQMPQSTAAESVATNINEDYLFDNICDGHFDHLRSDQALTVSQVLDLDDLDMFLLGGEIDNAFRNQQSPRLGKLLIDNHLDLIPQARFENGYDEPWTTIKSPVILIEDAFNEVSQRSPEVRDMIESAVNLLEIPPDEQDLYLLSQQLLPSSGSQEIICRLFESKTCRILSIKDDSSMNPWRTLVWPLAKDCPSLYHAIAAMTCLHMGKVHSQLHNQGIEHFRNSIEALTASTDSGNISLDAALATRLALGFAETWDHQKSSTGINHIKEAKILLQQAFSKDRISMLTNGELNRLTFLANTWIYMDVIARLTSSCSGSSIDFEFMTSCSQLGPVPPELQIDPLMGCASTLFPIIGRVADMVVRIRRSNAKRNSPAIISKALELKIALERWIPPVNLEISGSSCNILDSIQTAEAYRWAALLLIRQAVPELPNLVSLWELAQKVMVFLATVSFMSRATIVQIFPLMAAGCEALEEEDRDWVRKRWSLMSRHMVTGIVDRCIQVTDEVWRRRDEYEVSHGIPHISGAKIHSFSTASPKSGFAVDASMNQNETDVAEVNLNSLTTQNDSEDKFSAMIRARSNGSIFPISIALRNDVDLMTSRGCADYKVTGNLHWLAVMEDWNWEVMLG